MTIIICVEIADDDTVVPKVVVALDPTPDLEIEGKEATESEVELKKNNWKRNAKNGWRIDVDMDLLSAMVEGQEQEADDEVVARYKTAEVEGNVDDIDTIMDDSWEENLE